jgi:outer membrane protein OmpA-like peptidoglycan-associated protein
MTLPRTMFLLLIPIITFTMYAQRSRRPQVRSKVLEAVVVDTTAGPRWTGIVVEYKGERYVVMLHMNRAVEGGSIDPIIVGGNVEVSGTRVRIYYTSMDKGDIYAYRVVKLNNKTAVPNRMVEAPSRLPNTSTSQHGGVVTIDVDPALLPPNATYAWHEHRSNECHGLLTVTSRGISYKGTEGVGAGVGEVYRGSQETNESHNFIIPCSDAKDARLKVDRVTGRGEIPSMWIRVNSNGQLGVFSFYSKEEMLKIGTAIYNLCSNQPIAISGYIDVVEINGSSCQIRIITGEKLYSGVISFSRLSALIGRRINSYEDAVAALNGRYINLILSNVAPSADDVSGINFGGITQITIPTVPQSKQAAQTWSERNTATETVIDLSADILFDFDKSTIREDAIPTLIRLARLIRQSRNGTIQLRGYTDSIGSDDYNVGLSERRADTVRQWLVSKGGVDVNRLRAEGYGKSQPVAPNANPDGSDNPAGRQKNRRVEVIVPRS